MSTSTTAGVLTDTPASDANVNKNCAITNNSNISVLILDAQGDDVTPMQVGYEQNLSLMASNDGGFQALDAGRTQNYTLNDWYTDDDNTQQYSTNYQFIITTADCLFPVKMTHAHYNLRPKPHTYDSITIAQADLDTMKLTEQFLQTMMAYPSSTLAKGFQQAMSGATDSSGSIEDIDTAVANFFATTQQYKTITLASITAMNTYYSQYPYVWSSYQTSKTYYLYGSDGNTVTDQGSVQISIQSILPARTDKNLPYFTMTYTDPSGASRPLYYAHNQFVDNKNSDMPAVCLAGTFVLRSTLTKVATDTSVMPILAGTINGLSVLGYDQKQKQDSDGNWSGLYTLLHPKDAMGWVSLFMTATGIYMGLEMAFRGLQGLKDRLFKKRNSDTDQSDPTGTELEEIRSEAKADVSAIKADSQKLMDKLDKQIEVTEDVAPKMDEFQKKMTDQLNEDQRNNLQDNLADKSDFIEDTMLEYGNPPSLQKVSGDIDQTYDSLDSLSTEDLMTKLQGFTDHITEVINTNFSAEVDRILESFKNLSKEVTDSLKEAKDASTEVKETSDKIDEAKTDNENGETPDDMDWHEFGFEPGAWG
ncbi:hypothetical protein ACFQ4C_07600 [Larkinella insperata]|uniref:Uncharacterized protein n=1 Tax=Larkinella insperata TaxID=332158 RepID=A0ABW3Q5I0_9BACT